MASFFFPQFTEIAADGTLDLDNGTWKASLHTAVPATSGTVWADISGSECSGTGYTSGGSTLVGVTWVRTGSTTVFDANDVAWGPNASIASMRCLVIRESVANRLVLALDFGSDKMVVNNTMTYQFHATGIMAAAPA